MSEAKAKKLRTNTARPGDIVFTQRGTLGQVALVPEAAFPVYVISQSQMKLTVDPAKADRGYVYYACTSAHFIRQVHDNAVAAGVPHINLRTLRNLTVPLPPRGEQRRISAFLGCLDDRIDLLRQTNITLEAIAQALFKSWFVDFDPVRAKAEGREPEGMDAATAALFPSEFKDSELGLIPKGWRVRSLDSFATYLNGLALQRFPPESDSEYLPVIKIAQLRAGHTSGADRASARLKPDYIVRDGDVLFSWSGSLEVEFWCGGDGALNQHLFKVTSGEVPNWFCYQATKHFLPSFRETAANKATTMGHIQRRHLTEARLALPSSEFLNAVSPLIASLSDKRVCNALQAREIASLRDTLLPRLISGKLRLPEAESLIETTEMA